MMSIRKFEDSIPRFRSNTRPSVRGWMAVLIVGTFVNPQPAMAKDQMHGTPTVIAGDILDLNGARLQLWGIKAPPLDANCRLATKTIRCGHISKTALMDLTAAATVSCRLLDPVPAVPETARGTRDGILTAQCSSGGFDLSRNMLHTGWALAEPTAPSGFKETERAARKAGRGLWRGGFEVPEAWRTHNIRP